MYRIVQRNDNYWYAETFTVFLNWDAIDKDCNYTWSDYKHKKDFAQHRTEEQAMNTLKKWLRKNYHPNRGVKTKSNIFWTKRAVLDS